MDWSTVAVVITAIVALMVVVTAYLARERRQ